MPRKEYLDIEFLDIEKEDIENNVFEIPCIKNNCPKCNHPSSLIFLTFKRDKHAPNEIIYSKIRCIYCGWTLNKRFVST